MCVCVCVCVCVFVYSRVYIKAASYYSNKFCFVKDDGNFVYNF